jgi:hypothetical protein
MTSTDEVFGTRRVGLRGWQVAGGQVEPGPEQLRPHIVGGHARVRAEQGGDAARDDQGTLRVEPADQRFLFLTGGSPQAMVPTTP